MICRKPICLRGERIHSHTHTHTHNTILETSQTLHTWTTRFHVKAVMLRTCCREFAVLLCYPRQPWFRVCV